MLLVDRRDHQSSPDRLAQLDRRHTRRLESDRSCEPLPAKPRRSSPRAKGADADRPKTATRCPADYAIDRLWLVGERVELLSPVRRLRLAPWARMRCSFRIACESDARHRSESFLPAVTAPSVSSKRLHPRCDRTYTRRGLGAASRRATRADLSLNSGRQRCHRGPLRSRLHLPSTRLPERRNVETPFSLAGVAPVRVRLPRAVLAPVVQSRQVRGDRT